MTLVVKVNSFEYNRITNEHEGFINLLGFILVYILKYQFDIHFTGYSASGYVCIYAPIWIFNMKFGSIIIVTY